MVVCQNNKSSDWKSWRFNSCFIPLATFCSVIFTLVTPSLSGFACVENPCFHGICIDYLDINSTHQCYCRNGFTGYSCQINWDECKSNPCLNNGICTDGIASFNCSCPENFAGTLCQYDLSACDELFPCQNNGTCTIDPNSSNGTFICRCPPGFSGRECETDISVCNVTENACLNGGKCVDGIGVNFYCQCAGGWSGLMCEIEVDECDSQPCQNGGICINKIDDFSCACPFGYTGKACESKLRICEVNPCQNEAFCLHQDEDETQITCYCVPDFHGTLCEFRYDDCEPSPKCLNGGSCIDGVGEFTCSCPPEFFGPQCQCTLANLTDPVCHYNETIWPSITEIPLYPSATITDIPKITSDIIYISTTQLPSQSIFSITLKPEPTLISVPDSVLFSTQSQHENELPEPTIIFYNLSATPTQTELISITESIKTFSQFSTLILPSPEIVPTPSESETVYDPCPTISIEGTEGILLPASSMSLSPSLLNNKTVDTTGEPLLSSHPDYKSEVFQQSTAIVGSSFFISNSEDMLSLELLSSVNQPKPSSDIMVTIAASSISVPNESLQSVGSSEQDFSSGISSEFPATTVAQLSSNLYYPIESTSLIGYIPSSTVTATPQLPFTSTPKISEFIESFEFSTVELKTFPPFLSEISIVTIFPTIPPTRIQLSPTPSFPMLSPTEESAFSVLSPTEIISPSSIITDMDGNGVISTPLLLQSDLVTVSSSPHHSEIILNASIRSDDVNAFPPLIKTTVIDSDIFIITSLPQIITTASTDFVSPSSPSVSSNQEPISLNPTSSLPLITPESTITLATPTSWSETESDLCINYCQNNAKCISTSIQPICICPFKFVGDQCEKPRKKFTTTSFTGDSFLGYKVPNESINRISVVTKMATNAPEGILLYTSVGKLYALIFTQGGHVTLHFSCGAQSMHFVETRTRVDNGYNFTLEFNMEMLVHGVNDLHCVGSVSVNDSYIMRGEQIVGHNRQYENPIQLIYLGGVGIPDAQKNDELIGILSGFRGCLYKLTINQEEKDLFEDAIDGKEVSECSAFGCVTNPCFGESKCVPFNKFPFWQCICPAGYQGVRCQIRLCDSNPCANGATCTYPSDTNYYNNFAGFNNNSLSNTSLLMPPTCLCPLGFSGLLCQSQINTTKPSFRPLGFDYSAFIAYEPIPRFVDWVQMKFHFVTRNISQIALLVYSGYIHGTSVPSADHLETLTDLVKEGSYSSLELNNDITTHKISDFFAITYVHGYIALTWNLGSGTQRIITPSRIDRRLNVHTLFAGRSGRQAWLKVDGMRNVTGKSPGPFHRLNINTELFVGGYESFRFEDLPHDLPLHKGFDGCIFDFGFRVKNRLYLPQALRGRNIKSCYEEDC